MLFYYFIFNEFHHLFSFLWRYLLAVEVGRQPCDLSWFLLLRTIQDVWSLWSKHWFSFLFRSFLKYLSQVAWLLFILVLFLVFSSPVYRFLSHFCDILAWDLAFYVLLDMTIFLIGVFSDKRCEFFFIISKLSRVKVVLFEIWNERTLCVFWQDFWAVDFSDPRMENYLLDSNIRT